MGRSEALDRSTDNKMTNRKKTIGKIMIYKTLHRKLKKREKNRLWLSIPAGDKSMF
jgi:hypothetical protein